MKAELKPEDLTSLLPTEKQAEEYVLGYFGYDAGSDQREKDFVSGVTWVLDKLKQDLITN